MHTPNQLQLSLVSIEALKEQIAACNDVAVLADTYGAFKEAIEEFEAKAKIIGDAIKSRLEDGERAIGDDWSVLKSTPKPTERLDTKKLEEDLGKDVLKGYYKDVKNSPRLTVSATKLWEHAA